MDIDKPHVVRGELQSVENYSDIILQQSVGVLSNFMDSRLPGMDFPSLFALVPWGHHIEIIAKCRPLKKHCL